MNIIVFGGAGDMGSRAVEDLARTDGVARVTIADRAEGAAERLAHSLADAPAKVDVAVVDARDHEALVAAMQGYDVAASALGPFYVFETRLVRAAIAAGVHYASVCDDWSAAAEVLDVFDRPAREKGVTILTGLGTSPGLTSMCARQLADGMESVDRADVYVYQPLDGGGEAVLRHVFYVMSGEVACWSEGAVCMERALSRSHRVSFPKFGRIRVWNMGHTEPVTLPRFIPGVKESRFYMGYGRGAYFFVVPCKLGLFNSPRMRDWASRFLSLAERFIPGRGKSIGAIRVEVKGHSGGGAVEQMLCGIGNMREATGVSLAVGATMLGRGEVTVAGGGAYAPEGCLDPALFLLRMREKGFFAYSDLEMTMPVVP